MPINLRFYLPFFPLLWPAIYFQSLEINVHLYLNPFNQKIIRFGILSMIVIDNERCKC